MAGKGQELEERIPRSAAACNSCRSKKQKCGGEKPVCARCRAQEQECIWPEQQKRGPAKGYTEALEARLRDTENILSRILSHVSAEELQHAFSTSEVIENHSKLSTLDRKETMDHWMKFPLVTVENVLRWHMDHVNMPQFDPHDYPAMNEGDVETIEGNFYQPAEEAEVLAAQPSLNRSGSYNDQNMGHLGGSQWSATPAIPDQFQTQTHSDTSNVSIRPQNNQNMALHEEGSVLGLSSEFKQNFLW